MIVARSHAAADMGAVAIDGNDEEADEGEYERGIGGGKSPKTVPRSMIIACNGGSTEPPRMAMIRPAAPNFASSPRPLSAMP